MPRSSELSDFEKGIIIGYHKCGRSLRDISSDLKYPKWTVAYVIKKWKVSGDCRNVPRVGRPTKLGDRGRRVLTRELRKPAQNPDLNPIENLWDALHRRIQGCTTRPKSVKTYSDIDGVFKNGVPAAFQRVGDKTGSTVKGRLQGKQWVWHIGCVVIALM
ncbi:transposable element Tc1 transposase [Caerostris darwini]|uniref:Transposable element Tc1 transposase n=1 Tax=Caerostris darwini TaxID=1538125 RepID=A0AAV4REI6_9ARAC|nr:transposable element Tc1 transposase [Caerostris darwini]